MPHIEEGELHALLDGAYAHDAPAAARIREEIGSCIECRRRFDEAQALRMRAGALLERAVPSTAAPPFEAILERAEVLGAPRRMRLPGLARLAWAATIVLALGIGWFGRDRLYTAKRDTRPEFDAAARSQTAPATQPMTEPAPVPAPQQPVAAAAPPPAAPTPASSKLAAGNAAGAARGIPSEADARTQRAKSLERRSENAVAQTAAVRDSMSGRANAPARESADVAKAEVAALRAPALTDSAQWQYGTVEQAERIAGRRVLLVPGLEVVNVGVSRSGARYITRALQKLPDGNYIEIVQEPRAEADQMAGAAAARAPAAPPSAAPTTKDATGATVLMLTRNEWAFTGRATLSPDSLRVLLISVR